MHHTLRRLLYVTSLWQKYLNISSCRFAHLLIISVNLKDQRKACLSYIHRYIERQFLKTEIKKIANKYKTKNTRLVQCKSYAISWKRRSNITHFWYTRQNIESVCIYYGNRQKHSLKLLSSPKNKTYTKHVSC